MPAVEASTYSSFASFFGPNIYLVFKMQPPRTLYYIGGEVTTIKSHFSQNKTITFEASSFIFQ
jgi:hypothetical protein